MEAKFMQITPELARQWLATSSGNPRWNGSKPKMVEGRKVKRIAFDISNGNWNPGNSSIGFDVFGKLVDGHHRLQAVIDTGIPIMSMVIYGITEDGKQHIDDNSTRTIAQRTQIPGTVVSIAIMQAQCLKKDTNATVTSEWISDFVDGHPLLYKACIISRHGKATNGNQVRKKAYIFHAVFCALEFGIPEDTIERFCCCLNSGFSEGKSESAAIVLRNMLITDCGHISTRQRLFYDAAAQNAIYDFVNGTPRRNRYTNPEPIYFEELRKRGVEGFSI